MDTRIRDSFARQAFLQNLGAQITHLEKGCVQIEVPITPQLSQQQGFAHTGVAFSIGDSAAGYSALTMIDDGFEVVTSEMKIHLLAPAIGTHLRAKGGIIRAGRKLLVVEADVYALQADGSERHIAKLMGTMVPVPL